VIVECLRVLLERQHMLGDEGAVALAEVFNVGREGKVHLRSVSGES
jgi:hypothetical protein